MNILDILVICLAVFALAVSIISVVFNIVFFRMQIDLANKTMKDSNSLAEETKTVLNEIRVSQDITGKQVKDQYDKLLDAAIKSPDKKDYAASSAKEIQEVNERLISLEQTIEKGSSGDKLKEEIEELKTSFANLNRSVRTIISGTTESARVRTSPSRFEKFSQNARRSLTMSQEEAKRLKSESIDVAHFLLGLFSDEKFRAYKIVSSLKVDIGKIRKSIEYILPQGLEIKEELGLTTEAKRVIEMAIDESRQLKAGYVGTEHILLGILSVQGTVAALLNEYGVTRETTREKILLKL